jgi:hypothetical protein
MSAQISDLAPEKKIFLAGEGKNELGSWAKEIEHRDGTQPGVLETIMRKVQPTGWNIKDSICWKNLRKYQAGSFSRNEKNNVVKVCHKAIEKGCSTVSFSRDLDGVKLRQESIEAGIKESKEKWGNQLDIIGGCAVPCIEGWILAINGVTDTETMSRSKTEAKLKEKGFNEMYTLQMVESINKAGIENIPSDAKNLNKWISSAKNVLQ